jgi:anthranilate synthase/aminodeoxychorismate synthase-like glutamine amidotransferase
MILLIDNYDSFVHNLARHFRRLGLESLVVRNDAIDVAEAQRLDPQAIVISPGPCTPKESGCSLEIVRRLGAETPILGVCLGHQAIAAALGGEVVRSPEPMHGRTSLVYHDDRGVFAGAPQPLRACRYHSLIVEEASLPPTLEVTARTENGIVMGLRHKEWPVVGLQFHPEAILTDAGYLLLANFLRMAGIEPPVIPDGNDERPPGAAAPSPGPREPITF